MEVEEDFLFSLEIVFWESTFICEVLLKVCFLVFSVDNCITLILVVLEFGGKLVGFCVQLF